MRKRRKQCVKDAEHVGGIFIVTHLVNKKISVMQKEKDELPAESVTLNWSNTLGLGHNKTSAADLEKGRLVWRAAT